MRGSSRVGPKEAQSWVGRSLDHGLVRKQSRSPNDGHTSGSASSIIDARLNTPTYARVRIVPAFAPTYFGREQPEPNVANTIRRR